MTTPAAERYGRTKRTHPLTVIRRIYRAYEKSGHLDWSASVEEIIEAHRPIVEDVAEALHDLPWHVEYGGYPGIAATIRYDDDHYIARVIRIGDPDGSPLPRHYAKGDWEVAVLDAMRLAAAR